MRRARGRNDPGFWGPAPRSPSVGRHSRLGSRFRALRETAACQGGAGRRAGRPGRHPLQSPGPAGARQHQLLPFLIFVLESWLIIPTAGAGGKVMCRWVVAPCGTCNLSTIPAPPCRCRRTFISTLALTF